MASEIPIHSVLMSSFAFLTATCLFVPLFKKLGLGSVLGYLFAGLCLGPFGLKFYEDPKAILHFAELGVVFLLFVIGLELNFNKLWSLRKNVFLGGGLQVGLAGLLLSVLLYFVPSLNLDSMSVALILGFTLALSSTAFAMQILKEKNETQTPYGQTSFAILLFQDLFAIPLIAIVPLLSLSESSETGVNILAILKPVVVIALILGLGRYFLKYFFRFVAQSGIKEVFTASSLTLVLGVSLVMEFAGLSMALGAFLSGVLLAESEYRHELEADIEPFKGLLLGLFFTAVGMNMNLSLLKDHLLLIILISFLLVTIKFSTLKFIGYYLKLNKIESHKMSVLISQSGEFGFVILGLALTTQIINSQIQDFFVLVISLTMFSTPFLILIFEKICDRNAEVQNKDYETEFEHKEPRVLIAGFGRFGQMTARVLTMQKIPFTTLELSSDHVETAIKFGYKIYYGDATRLDLLHAAGADQCEIALVAIDDVEMSLNLVRTLKSHFPKIKILARARNRQHYFDLRKLDVNVIHREIFLSSVEMAKDVLLNLKYTESDAQLIIQRFKEHDLEVLEEQFKVIDEEEMVFVNKTREMNSQLEQILKEETRASK